MRLGDTNRGSAAHHMPVSMRLGDTNRGSAAHHVPVSIRIITRPRSMRTSKAS
jgi:hypothetical protein